ncbi:hypothetical protein HK104_004267 [Borealophlyctis nickersoniae]|nr:hypothetical protein HK104_004267 [Borealophlyctis nickersoniae]
MNWVVDGLPAAQIALDRKTQQTFYNIGFQLGLIGPDDKPYLHNHYDIHIMYHTEDDAKYRVVGVIVWPYSSQSVELEAGCNYAGRGIESMLHLNEEGDTAVVYTYNVQWISSPVAWGTRWDNYLYVFDPQIHWFSIVNSIVIVLMLTGMIATILLRALHKDIARYNTLGEEDGSQEDYGWKLVHADAFRSPPFPMMLSVLVGNGAQLLLMTGVTLVLAVLGFLSPSNRGALSTVVLVFYVCFAGVAGYVSARMYKMFQGEHYRRNVLLTAFALPGTFFGIFVVLNFFLISAGSSAAVPFGTMFALMCMWFLVSVPLCVVGAYFGFKQMSLENPCKVNQIPRQIPSQPLYLNPVVAAIIGGILAFGAIFIELYFIMNSIWFHRIYYVFGFLFLVFIILVITCSEVSVLMCYFHLCSEDYRWPWRAFATAGASGFYVFLYSIVYYARKLHIGNLSSTILYFGWSCALSVLFTILTGTVGYIATLFFVRKIFQSIKVD